MSGTESTEPAVSRLLSERTYERLKTGILSGELPPGTALSVPELARQLNLSRSPVREAVQRLIYDGLAVHVPHRGAEVSQVNSDDLRELYTVRELLEGLAARLATERSDAAGIAALQDILDEHEQALTEDPSNARHIELDMRFHREIRHLAANSHLTAALDPISGRSHFALHSLWRTPDAPRLALDEHHRIAEAIIIGDPALAESAAREHIARLRTRLTRARAFRPEDGRPSSRTKARLQG